MAKAPRNPIGLQLARTAKAVSQAFDAALSEAGGSLATWVVLMNLKSGQATSQRELADAVGIQGATLTHHLNAMERDGLLTRRRDPHNRRVHLVDLTALGEQAFQRLRTTAIGYDKRLRAGISAGDIATLDTLLKRLAGNAGKLVSGD